MKRKMIRGMKILGRALAMCLCAVLLCSAAFTEKAETPEAPVDLGSTEGADRIMDVCTLPDGRVLLAGHTESPDESGSLTARLLCLNPDRTVCWDYKDPGITSFYSVAVTKDNAVAVFCDDLKVRRFTAEGEPSGVSIDLSAGLREGGLYSLTSFGVLWFDTAENKTVLTGWDGNAVFRAGIPDCMWAGSEVMEAPDGLILCGREAGDPAEARAKVIKIDLQGATVWETVLPHLSEERDMTGARSVLMTGDGGCLVSVWDYRDIPGEDYGQGSSMLFKLDAGGQILWRNESPRSFWYMAEYDGKYVSAEQEASPDNGCRICYVWLDTDGNELGTTEYTLREDAYPPYTDSTMASVSMEEFILTEDGLWQLYTFWEPDAADPDDEAPAWTQQDNALVRVPIL